VAKNKVSLQQSLAVLHAAIIHTEKFSSHSTALQDQGTPRQTAIQQLQRTLNQMNVLMELSDFQVMAALLSLPTNMESDTFTYYSPDAAVHFMEYDRQSEHIEIDLDRAFAQFNDARDARERADAGSAVAREELAFVDDCIDAAEYSHDEPDVAPENFADNGYYYTTSEAFAHLGNVPLYTVDNDTGGGKVPVPYSAQYRFRGGALRDLNRFEYAAVLETKKQRARIRQPGSVGRPGAVQYPFGLGLAISSSHMQQVKSKQGTVISCSRPPQLPGAIPTGPHAMAAWNEKRTRYAKYVLVNFRPESDVFEAGHVNTYQYSWEALQVWLLAMRASHRAIDRLHLKCLHNHLYME
jgi:hypothetical protein